MHNEKHQFEIKKNRRHRVVGRSGGGYVVGGIPWSQLYYGGYGYYGGYYGGVGPGNNNGSGQESDNGATDAAGGTGDGASDGGGSGGM